MIIAMRTRKLFTVRDDLIAIFSLVVKFDLQVPKIRQFLLNSLTYQQNCTNQEDSVKIDNRRLILEKESKLIKTTVLDLLCKIKNLHENHKFFSKPFVLQDKDYLKYISKEMTELRGLFSVFKVQLD